ncbi:MAG: agmatinase [Candidatus Bathyarchaeota archaeon]|jgi:agmatinase
MSYTEHKFQCAPKLQNTKASGTRGFALTVKSSDDCFFGLKVEELDLANLCVVGFHWDISSQFRKGSREAPDIIRKITTAKLYDPFTEDGADLTRIWQVYDYGNIRPANSVDEMRKKVYNVIRDLYNDELRFLFLGGDHLVTYFVLHALTKLSKRSWALIYLDAHLDLEEAYEGDRYSHGSVVRRLVEETNLRPQSTVEVGVRSFHPSERKFAESVGIKTVSTVEFERLGATGASKRVLELLPRDVERVYVSIDLDILDPAYAPGLGYPEPAGISTRGLIDFLFGLKELEIAAFDVVELCPQYDSAGITTIGAGKVILETLGIMRPGSKRDAPSSQVPK